MIVIHLINYFKKLKKKKNKIVYNAKNKNYDTGAYWYAYNKFKKAKFFFIFFKTLLYLKKIYLIMKKMILLLLDIFYLLNKIGKIPKNKKEYSKQNS